MSELDKAIQQARMLFDAHSGEAVDLLLATARIRSVGNILVGALLLLFAVYLCKKIRTLIKKYGAYGDEMFGGSVLFIMSFLAGIMFIGAFVILADIFNWIGIFRPDIYLMNGFISSMELS